MMEREQRPLALRTTAGPVDLRPPRQERRITTNEGASARTIKKGWLKDTQGDASYQKAVKQAMMIAAEELRLMDAKEASASEYSKPEIEGIQERIQKLQHGNARFPLAGTKKKKLQNVTEHRGDRKRDTLMKISRKRPCCSRVERSFILDNGQLLVYRDHHPNAKVKAMYQLKDATCFYEDRNSASLPKWMEGYSKRLRVICSEREKQSKSPLFLYSKDDSKIYRWKRAFTLAKVLVSENDRRALKVSIGRAVSGALQKAWDALSTYYGEYSRTKALVKNMAMRLMKVDISRGWMKFKLVYKKREELTKRQKEQQLWAARFMSEKLTKLGKQKAKEIMDVREGVITRIQQRFRSYREDMIFDRTYPLSSSMMSRVQQAKVGRHLDFTMQTVSADDVCHVSLYREVADPKSRKAWETWKKDKEVLRSMTPAYSALHDGFLPVQPALVYASDNLSALFFSERSAADAPSAFDKTDWSKFINMDRISSVILHSDPGGATVMQSGDSGVWCTVNGPRVAWDRQVVNNLDKDPYLAEDPKLRGHADHIKVASDIATGQAKRWVQLTGIVDQVMLQKPKQLQDTDFKTKAVFHILGYSFESEVREGSNPTYNLKAEAAVPVAAEDFVSLDQSEVGLEIFQVLEEWETETKQKEQLLYVGSEFLTKIFDIKVKEDGSPSDELCHRLKDCGSVKLYKGGPYKLQLWKPGDLVTKLDEIRPKEKTPEQIEEEVIAEVDVIWNKDPARRLIENPCVSPELVGGGNTTLYTSNRAAWFDPELGAGKFRPDHVANYVELSLASLTFQPSEKQPAVDKALDLTYYVRASVCGISVSSSALHRAKPAWSQVLPYHLVDPNMIRFEGQRLLVPLPAGCWAEAERRKVKIEVVEVARQNEAQSLSFEEFKKVAGKDVTNSCRETVKYKAVLTFDSQMLVDQPKTLGVFVVKPDQEEMQMDVFQPYNDEGIVSEGILSLDFCLRDRDHARATMGQPSQRSSLCVGDKAMLILEEPFSYPKDASEFRKQFCVGEYSAKKKEWGAPGAPLREPCLSSEYADSGLGELVPKRPFKQSFIPTFCDDIMPYKYVLPLSEKDFMDQHKAGFWTRIMDDFAKGVARGEHRDLPYRSGPNKPVVSHLTHMNRHVPVNVLAVYADGTCDLEITELFMKKWEEQKSRKFAFFGKLRAEQGRYVLTKVPQILVGSVHYSGINVYDSAFKSTEDVLRAPKPSNAFDPRSAEAAQNAPRDQLYEYRLAAGPLPPDASPACCTYEFSVRLRFPSEFEMYHFVAMLRRCVRVDHYQQASKMLEYQKQHLDGASAAPRQRQIYKSGGQLEVLLVEARRLKPLQSALNTVLQSDPIALYESWSKGRTEGDPSQSNQMLGPDYLPELMGTTDGRMPKQTPNGSPIATFVNFRMLHPIEAAPGEKPGRPEVVPYRGQKVQISSVINGTDSPIWARESELEATGGWTFRTGMIDPDKFPRLLLEFEVMQAAVFSATRIGLIQIPVTEEQFLTNPEQRFKNLWLPLVNIKDGQQTPNITGEIHVMTHWLPAEMKQVFSDGREKMQLSTRQMFNRQIWHKVSQKCIREPIYGTEALYFRNVYNPNTVRVNGVKVEAETFKNTFRRHVEELSHAVPYLECLERRQLNAWNLFKNELVEKGLENRSLGELRLHWQDTDNMEMLNKLQSLILRGVPSALRPQVWAEVTLASRVSATDGAGQTRDYADEEELALAAEKEYQALLARGMELNSDAMHQLHEDSVLLLAWENTSPPLPEALKLHLKRIEKAKNVVTALLACEDGGVASSESLLVLAFFLLLPQGYKEASTVTADGLTQPSEQSVFWLLYTLVCHRYNGMYREYYGLPVKRESDPECLIAGCGAMQDVNLLECCVAYHERDLFFRMNALGFELSTIFYGAFMRWYATLMPTATVFRFWDALLFQSTNPKTQSLGGRDYLIDLAFATLQVKRNELMECESAAEMKGVVLGFLGSLYDTTTVIDLVHAADLYLWGGAGFSSGKVSYLWTQRDEMFKGINQTTKWQNQILHRLAFEGQVRPPKHPTEQFAGVTTKQLVEEVIPTLQINVAGSRSSSSARHWAMHRPMPLVARTMLQSSTDKAWGLLSSLSTPDVPMIPFLAEPPKAQVEDGSMRKWNGMEPLNVQSTEIISTIQRHTPGWSAQAPDLWRYFANIPVDYPGAKTAVRQTAVQKMMGGILGIKPTDPNVAMTQPKQSAEGTFEQSLSLNELFGALICCSRGTVASKAAALFDLYSYGDPRGEGEHEHVMPSNKVAKIAAGQATDANAEKSRILAPADAEADESKRDNVLRIQVMTSYPKDGVLGDVLIPSLSPFISARTPVLKTYNIWGKTGRDSAGAGNAGGATNAMNNGVGEEKRVCLGEIFMAIQWQPRNFLNYAKGQLTVQVKHIKFHEFHILEPYNINPFIHVYMSRVVAGSPGSREWAEIKRWDPRTHMTQAQQQKVGVFSRGPYGGVIKFDPTMRQRAAGGGATLGHWVQHGKDQGWVPLSADKKVSGHWVWNDVWGKQSSILDLEVASEFVKYSSRRNCIDLMGIRLLVSQVLQRCMMNMSNRQAVLVADSIFNRAGVVPGIYQAILAQGTDYRMEKIGLPDIMARFEERKKPYVDVTREMVFEHERQIACNGGQVNLFAPSYMYHQINLQTMGISDPYPDQEKTLYIHFIRGGDGERCTEAIDVDKSGNVQGSLAEVQMDALVKDTQEDWLMNRVTKEEFIACFCGNPLLAESLRRLSSGDSLLHRRSSSPLEAWLPTLAEFGRQALLPKLSEFGPRPQDICKCKDGVVMRWEEDPNSEIIRRLPAGEKLEILKPGTYPVGRPFMVKDSKGNRGWISALSKDGAILLEITKRGNQSLTGTGQVSTLPENGPRPQDICVCKIGIVMRWEEDVNSDMIRRLPAGEKLEILKPGADPKGRPFMVKDSKGNQGWISALNQKGTYVVEVKQRGDQSFYTALQAFANDVDRSNTPASAAYQPNS